MPNFYEQVDTLRFEVVLGIPTFIVSITLRRSWLLFTRIDIDGLSALRDLSLKGPVVCQKPLIVRC